ncbi:MAG: enoyl-CoA hydratase/isomerase family protein [Thermodesulfobacteriota bacterium]
MYETEKKDGEAVFDCRGFLGTITLKRPGKRNALTYELWLSLARAVQDADNNDQLRVLVLKGEGESFCSGLDVSSESNAAMLVSGGNSPEQRVQLFRFIKRIQSIHTELEQLRVPTIAAIQGHCIGAGLELVCCCDMRFCSSNAVFSLPEATFGIVTDVGGLQRLPRIIGSGKAREMAFRGHTIGSEEARRIGLVNEVFDTPQELDDQVEQIAGEIASQSAQAVQGAKEVFLHDQEVPMTRSLEFNAARSALILPSEELKRAIESGRNKATDKGSRK